MSFLHHRCSILLYVNEKPEFGAAKYTLNGNYHSWNCWLEIIQFALWFAKVVMLLLIKNSFSCPAGKITLFFEFSKEKTCKFSINNILTIFFEVFRFNWSCFCPKSECPKGGKIIIWSHPYLLCDLYRIHFNILSSVLTSSFKDHFWMFY